MANTVVNCGFDPGAFAAQQRALNASRIANISTIQAQAAADQAAVAALVALLPTTLMGDIPALNAQIAAAQNTAQDSAQEYRLALVAQREADPGPSIDRGPSHCNPQISLEPYYDEPVLRSGFRWGAPCRSPGPYQDANRSDYK